MSEHIFILNNGVIYWKTFKQSNIANSICETKCIAAFDACKEAMWLYRSIGKLAVAPFCDCPIVLYSTRVIAHAKEPKFH